jgi:hypothetical protein
MVANAMRNRQQQPDAIGQHSHKRVRAAEAHCPERGEVSDEAFASGADVANANQARQQDGAGGGKNEEFHGVRTARKWRNRSAERMAA